MKITYLVCCFCSFSMIEQPLGEELNRTLWIGLVCFGQTFSEDRPNIVLLEIFDVWMLWSHDIASDLVTTFKFAHILNLFIF